jgi:hypothetical protein
MGRVTVLIVNVVDVVAVRDRLVVAALFVDVAVVAMLGMGRLALVPMAVMPIVHVPLVKVVAMAFVNHGGVPAVGAMLVSVMVMRSMVGARHGMPPACGVTGSIAMSARCSSVSLTMLARSQPTLRSVWFRAGSALWSPRERLILWHCWLELPARASYILGRRSIPADR